MPRRCALPACPAADPVVLAFAAPLADPVVLADPAALVLRVVPAAARAVRR
ncbi:hypothetical protein ACFC60_34160 [Kitasatospora purpeofusca]|uniref:hypothetical protein n=1 Tax=Kitasatospora purpeofusca TaxID=67352 RepID=UPI0035D99A20